MMSRGESFPFEPAAALNRLDTKHLYIDTSIHLRFHFSNNIIVLTAGGTVHTSTLWQECEFQLPA